MPLQRFSKDNLAQLVELQGLNARMLSERCEELGHPVSLGHIDRILRGDVPNPGIVTLLTMAKAAGVHITDFFETEHPWLRADYRHGKRILEMLDSSSGTLVTVSHTLLGYMIPDEMKLTIKEAILRGAGLGEEEIARRLDLVRAGIPLWKKEREEGTFTHRILAPKSALGDIAKAHPEWVAEIILAATRWMDATAIAFMDPKPWTEFERKIAEWTSFPNWRDVFIKDNASVFVYSGCELHYTANPGVVERVVQIVDSVSLDAVRYFPVGKKVTPHGLTSCNKFSILFMDNII